MVLFNSPLPYDKARMAGLRTRPASAHDYFLRQGTDADALAAELATPDQRRRYIATFYSSRFWAHPGAFDDAAIAFHAEPFGDGAKLRLRSAPTRASSPRRPAASRRPDRPATADTPTLILFGPSDHVIYARLRPHGRLASSTATSARSCCATAGTSSSGRRPTRCEHGGRVLRIVPAAQSRS